jgi:GNAT superfamily N-acetyltransferase
VTRESEAQFVIRRATIDDVPILLTLIRQLAEHQGALDQVHTTEDGLRSALFSANPAAFAHVAERSGGVVGYALWYLSFSPWAGRQCIWLADLYVEPDSRRLGIACEFVHTLARRCIDNGYERIEWKMQDSNSTAEQFYRHIGASPQEGRVLYQLKGDALR